MAENPSTMEEAHERHVEHGIQFVMITTAVVIVILVGVSSRGRQANHATLRIILQVTSQLSIPQIALTLGKLHRDDYGYQLLSMSLLFLQIILMRATSLEGMRSKPPSFNSFEGRAQGEQDEDKEKGDEEGRQEDSSGAGTDTSIQLTYMIWISSLLSDANQEHILYSLFWLVWCLIMVKLGLRYFAARRANGSFAIGRNPMLVAGYMQQQQEPVYEAYHQPEEAGDSAASSSVSGYRYLVMGEEKQKGTPSPKGYIISESHDEHHDKHVTMDKIEKRFGCGRVELKSLCLSFALFKLLRRRFEGYPLAESGTREALDLVLSGPLGDEDKAFKLVEVEVSFLDDYYNSSFFVACQGWFFICNVIHFIMMLTFCVIIVVVVITDIPLHLDPSHHDKAASVLYINVAVLFLVMAATLFIEAREILTYLCSDWLKVKHACMYVSRFQSPDSPRWLMWGADKVLSIVCHLPRLQKPWNNKLRQYSLLDDKLTTYCSGCRCRCCFCCCCCCNSIIKRRRRKAIKVPKEVKSAIVESLKISQGRLITRGEESLRRNKVSQDLFWACQNSSTTEMILVWHVATSFCDMQQSVETVKATTPKLLQVHRMVACSLSKYCAYLVAYVPELLPDDVNFTIFTIDGAVSQARRVLEGRRVDQASKLDKLTKLSGQGNVIEKGAHLGRQLMQEIKDGEQRWKVVAEVWAEMLLYVAPSNNTAGHAKCLAKGGEFITLVWALLTHAGIVDRPQLPPPSSWPGLV